MDLVIKIEIYVTLFEKIKNPFKKENQQKKKIFQIRAKKKNEKKNSKKRFVQRRAI